MDQRVLAIVDPYTLGVDLARTCASMGVRGVAVQSTSNVPPLFAGASQLDALGTVVCHDGDLEATGTALARENAGWVLAAAESGVVLADRLADWLGVPSNGSAASSARRNKCLMAERAAHYGVRTPPHHCSRELRDLLCWIDANTAYPVIVKPPESVASDAVALCRSAAEVGAAFHRILDRENVLGVTNRSVMVQEFLDGTEYVVDSVSWAGRHRMAAFWRYRRPALSGGFVCYDAMELLPGDGELQRTLAAFTCRALDALGIQYGPAHTEIMITDGDPILVEAGARLTAARNATLGRLCGVPCQVDLAVEAFRDPQSFLAALDTPYRLQRSAANAFLVPSAPGTLVALPRLGDIERLPSFREMSVRPRFGEPVPRVLGVVTLVHDRADVLRADLEALKRLEGDGFYVTDRSGA